MKTGKPLLTFYGDDFTGSVDVLLQYQRFGLRGKIFLSNPTDGELRNAAAEFPVVGVAGVTRSFGPSDIAAALEPALTGLAGLDPDLLQYKVCSTADSSADIGSFAPAIRIGRRLCGQRPIPVLVAQPNLGRYTVFSNHFAVDRGEVYRLDRQPVMAKHPVTPMREADLRRHLTLQINKPVGAITVQQLHGQDGGRAAYRRARDEDLAAVVVDSLDEQDLRLAGELLLESANGGTLFGVGSGGLSVAVASALGYTEQLRTSRLPAMSGPCLAVSGSCSPLTWDQIRFALAHGWHGIRLDLKADGAEGRAADDALSALRDGHNVVVYTCGDDQPPPESPIKVAHLARALAQTLISCAEQIPLDRVIIAGGDTSGHVLAALGATAMISKVPAGKYTMLCEIEAENRAIDGLEVVLKGGQIGEEDFFEFVRKGDGE